MNLFLSAAIISAKASSLLSKTFGWRGSSLPGRVARKIYPGTLQRLANQSRKGIIMVTGTNGKTTTNNMVASILKAAGNKVIINQEGANLIYGVTASFVKEASFWGRVDCDYALLEVDEASFPKVVAEVKPQIVVITNFFRDQLDRYGELDTTVSLVRNALQESNQTHLILNADDPLVAQFQKTTGLTATFYGLAGSQRAVSSSSQMREAKFCPFCGQELVYKYYHYSQLGAYRCPGCSFIRPTPEVEAGDVENLNGVTGCTAKYRDQSTRFSLNTQGFYNLYNALAAFSTGIKLGVSADQIVSGLAAYRPAIGRMESFSYHGKQAFLNLVKNPTGYNEGLATLLSFNQTKDVFMALNDNDADGRDISWLWDVDFEYLGAHHQPVLSFVCSGTRGFEMAMRLKYAGVPAAKIKVVDDLASAIKTALQGSAEMTYLFSTYTVLWAAQKILLACEKE